MNKFTSTKSTKLKLPALFAVFLLISVPMVLNKCQKLDVQRITIIHTGSVELNRTTAKLFGYIVDLSNKDHSDLGFCYGMNPEPTINDSVIKIVSAGKGPFEGEAINLKTNATYYFRMYVKEGEGVKYGEIISKTTPAGTLSVIETKEITEITIKSAKTSARVSDLGIGTDSILQHGFCYSNANGEPTISDSIVNLGSTSKTSEFSAMLTNLQPDFKYFVRPFATTILGTAYGQVVEFKTSELPKMIGDMMLVLGGTFTMGCDSEQKDCNSDEKPPHLVTLSSFYIDKFEVTCKRWRDVMGSNSSFFDGCDDCPVDGISWDDIQGFITKLNNETGKKYRLPTEAEWEFAARGGIYSKGYEFAGSDNISEVAWFVNNSSLKTHAVGTKTANELGVYDMSGNVREVCSDWYGYYSSKAQKDPQGPSSGPFRVVRGGYWNYLSTGCRVTSRSIFASDKAFDGIGFRLVIIP